jgi:dTDP-4-amino-4,6-dideoxygalactose transaminase
VSRIPLVDLAWQHAAVADEVRRGFEEVMAASAFILGPPVAAFEREYARFSELPYCVGVASGTDALELALRASGVGRGDEVILPANTFIATATAVLRAGAEPVLVDVDPDAHLLGAAQIGGRLGPRTRAVVAVHLYGQLAPVEELAALARDAGVLLLEDAAQCHGARRHGRPAGSLGAAAATSFYPGKNLGAYGDAGAVVTRHEAIAEGVERWRNYGRRSRYEHDLAGFNSRLDTLQAVVLRAKLRHLAEWNEARREAARRYDALLADLPAVARPRTLPGNEHVFHLYVVRVPDRDRVLEKLRAEGIGAGVHYPLPLHLQPALRDLGHGPGDFPETERAAREVLSLPIYPGIQAAQQERIVDVLRSALP